MPNKFIIKYLNDLFEDSAATRDNIELRKNIEAELESTLSDFTGEYIEFLSEVDALSKSENFKMLISKIKAPVIRKQGTQIRKKRKKIDFKSIITCTYFRLAVFIIPLIVYIIAGTVKNNFLIYSGIAVIPYAALAVILSVRFVTRFKYGAFTPLMISVTVSAIGCIVTYAVYLYFGSDAAIISALSLPVALSLTYIICDAALRRHVNTFFKVLLSLSSAGLCYYLLCRFAPDLKFKYFVLVIGAIIAAQFILSRIISSAGKQDN